MLTALVLHPPSRPIPPRVADTAGRLQPFGPSSRRFASTGSGYFPIEIYGLMMFVSPGRLIVHIGRVLASDERVEKIERNNEYCTRVFAGAI